MFWKKKFHFKNEFFFLHIVYLFLKVKSIILFYHIFFLVSKLKKKNDTT